MAHGWVRLLLALAPALATVFASRAAIHYFQLESYQFPGYFRTLRRNRVHAYLPGAALGAFCFGVFYLLDLLTRDTESASVFAAFAVGAAALCVGAGVLTGALLARAKMKKPLRFTPRVKRLYAVYALLLCGGGCALTYGARAGALTALLPFFLPWLLALAGLIAWPIEKAISEMYFRDARRKLLSSPELTRVGITGSYGKTSVKVILGTILSARFPTLVTPASFNTPMGVTRTIRERLTPAHRVFVGEMGARHVGDVRELCRLVKPQIGILTSVGPQHLDTFKTVSRIANTKYELIEALPQDGLAVFADDGGVVRSLYEKTKKPKRLASLTDENADVWAGRVSLSENGSTFLLRVRGLGEIECRTRLLGRHNILNIATACAVAAHLGLTLREMRTGIAALEPVQSRLELMRTTGGYTVINDAFNSNPNGAKAALDVLAAFPGRRIIVTPGMVELGADEEKYNRAFGAQIAEAANLAIVIGKKRAEPILQGLRDAGFPMENARRVDSLDASTALLRSIARAGDVVLYENDLPDNYQEA